MPWLSSAIWQKTRYLASRKRERIRRDEPWWDTTVWPQTAFEAEQAVEMDNGMEGSVGKLRFFVINGPVASGRTTACIEMGRVLAAAGRKVAVLSSEEGFDSIEGLFIRKQGMLAISMQGACVGSQSDDFIAELRRLRDQEGVDVVMIEMPNVCACSPDHVYAPVRKKCPGEFDLAPLMVTITGQQVLAIMDDDGKDPGLHSVNYLHSEHLRSADAIAVTKADLLEDGQAERCRKYLADKYPNKTIVVGSLLEGEMAAAMADAVLAGEGGFNFLSKEMDKKLFAAGEGFFTTFSERICVMSRDESPIDFDAFGNALIEEIRAASIDSDGRMEHATLVAEFPSRTVRDAGALRVTCDSDEVERPLVLKEPHGELRIAIRVKHTGSSQKMLRQMIARVDGLAEKWKLDLEIFLIESFGVHDEGKRHYVLLKHNDHDKFDKS